MERHIPVRIVALHQEGSDIVNLTGDVYDVIVEKGSNTKENQVAATSRMEKPSRSRADRPDANKVTHLLENVKASNCKFYKQNTNNRPSGQFTRKADTGEAIFLSLSQYFILKI